MHRFRYLQASAGGAVALLCAAAVPPATAQEPGFSPAQVERQLPHAPNGEEAVVEARPPAGEAVAVQAPTFVLAALLVEGATVYDAEALLSTYDRFLGRPVTLRDLEAVAAAITERYRADGYVLVRTVIPAQAIELGVVRLRVIEGYVTGLHGEEPADQRLRPYLRPVTSERPLRIATLQRALLNMAALPGVSLRPQLRVVDSAAGAHALVLNAERRSFDGTATIDNRGSDFVGPWEGVLSLHGYDTLGAGELLQLRLAVARETDELRYGEVHGAVPVGDDGLLFRGRASRLLARPGGDLESLDVRSRANRYSVGLSYPLRRTVPRADLLDVSLGAYHSRTAVGADRVLEDDLYTLELGLRQSFRHPGSAVSYLNTTATFGLDWGDSQTRDSGTVDQQGTGNADFSKLHIRGIHTRPLDAHWEVLAMLDAQYADIALPGSERYSVGGAQFGRAYDPSELTGDRGAAARLDLIREGLLRGEDWKVSPYGFYDIGAVWNVDSGGRRSAASAGAGLRWQAQQFSGSLELAQPLTRDVASEGDDGDQPRWFVRFSYRF